MFQATRLILATIIFFSSVSSVLASSVVINEFQVEPTSLQWVELYNKGTEPVNIGGWFIDDDGGSQKYTIPTETIINPGEIKEFTSGLINLSGSNGDTVRLLNGINPVDSYTYAVSPGDGHSYGRNPDGGDTWAIFNSPSKGSSNNSSPPAPTFTPVPTLTTKPPTATPTLKPTTKPSSTPTPTSSFKSTSAPTLTPTKSSFATITLAGTPPSVTLFGEAKDLKQVLGASAEAGLEVPDKGETLPTQPLVKSDSSPQFSLVSIALSGVAMSISAIIWVVWKRYKKTQSHEL